MSERTKEEQDKLDADKLYLYEFIMDSLETGSIVPEVATKFRRVMARECVEGEEIYVAAENTTYTAERDEDGNLPWLIFNDPTNYYKISYKQFKKRYAPDANMEATAEFEGHDHAGLSVFKPQGVISNCVARLTEENLRGKVLVFAPNGWGGATAEIKVGGTIILPFDNEKTLKEHIKTFRAEGVNKLDFYPVNDGYYEETYAECDKYGVFKGEDIREQTGQEEQAYSGYPYSAEMQAMRSRDDGMGDNA